MHRFRVLHGHHHVPDSRQFGASSYDGENTRTNTKSYDRGTYCLESDKLTPIIEDKKDKILPKREIRLGFKV